MWEAWLLEVSGVRHGFWAVSGGGWQLSPKTVLDLSTSKSPFQREGEVLLFSAILQYWEDPFPTAKEDKSSFSAIGQVLYHFWCWLKWHRDPHSWSSIGNGGCRAVWGALTTYGKGAGSRWDIPTLWIPLQTLQCWDHGSQLQRSRLRCFKRWSYRYVTQLFQL